MKDAVAKAVDRGADHLSSDILAQLERDFDRCVNRALRANPRPKHSPTQRGRPRASPACNLADRDLRMSKVKQKVSGCFRSLEGARAFAPFAATFPPLTSKAMRRLPPCVVSLMITLFSWFWAEELREKTILFVMA